MAKEKILVVDDEKDIIELVEYHLKKAGYKVLSAKSGGEAIDIAANQTPSLVILDLMMPGLDGIEVFSILRRNEKTRNIPVVMLTAKSSEEDIISGLKTGADDYITKPFSPKVFVARVETVLRRGKLKNLETELIKISDLTIDIPKHEVTVKEKQINLTTTEYNILFFLAKNQRKVFSREQILNNAWSYDTIIVDRAVDVHIKSLREKLGKSGRLIQTIRGVGYSLKPFNLR